MLPEVLLDETIDDMRHDFQAKLVQSCPQKVFSLGEGVVNVEDTSKCNFCQNCVRLCSAENKPHLISIKPIESFITFDIESVGSISSLNIFKQACNILKSQVKKTRHVTIELETEYED